MELQGLIKRIVTQSGDEQLVSRLLGLSSSDLSSLLIEVFRQKSLSMTASELQKNYETNRFVGPAVLDVVSFMEFELKLLSMAQQHGFIPLELSPVSPFGACSTVGTVNQDKIISALRGTEVTADATNLMALECAKLRKMKKFSAEVEQFCSIHRHVRTPLFKGRLSFAHFKIFCLVSAGKDTGSQAFEKEHLLKHLRFYIDFLSSFQYFDGLSLSLKATQTDETIYEKLCAEIEIQFGKNITITKEKSPQTYYKHIQFKIWANKDGESYELGDGGFVDWTQQLTNNKKERMMSSGLGLERLFKILH